VKPSLRLRERTQLAPSSRSAASSNVQLRGGGPAFELPSSVAMFIGAAGIFVSFSIFAVLQEDVYKKMYGDEKFAFTFFVLVIERGINALSALLGVSLLGPSGLVIPLVDIFQSGVSQMLAMAASNEALRYVSYPTQVLGKSCKMVPVMAGGIIFGGKQYSTIEYLQVALITLGVCVFNFGGKSKKSGADSPFGLALIGLSLLMDMVTGGLQDKVKLRTKELNPMAPGPKRPSMHESMLWTNVSGFFVALALALVSGHLWGGISFCTRHPEVAPRHARAPFRRASRTPPVDLRPWPPMALGRAALC
jgi:UDP-galactose transporter B1